MAHAIVDMWNVDSVIIVPAVVSALGLIAKSLKQKPGLGLIQKAVLLDPARIVRRFLSLEP